MNHNSAGGSRTSTRQDGPTIDLTMDDDDDEATPSDFVDYYEILGVSKAASGDELKKAYRKQALRWHPDKNPNTKEHAEVQFKLVAEAYEILSDPDRRGVYDRYGREGLANRRTGSQRTGARQDDPFASFFQQSSHGNPFGRRGHFSFFVDPFDLFRQFFGSSDPFGFQDQDDELDDFGFGHGFMGPSLFQHHFSLFNRPSLFSPFGTSAFQAIQDHGSHPGSSFVTNISGSRGAMPGRSVSTSIQMVNGKTTKTTRITENGVETVTVEENGVETSRHVNGAPVSVSSSRPMESLPSTATQQGTHMHASSTRHGVRPHHIPAARVIPTSFSSGHHHHHYTHSHPTTSHSHAHPSASHQTHRSHVHRPSPPSSSAHHSRHQQQVRHPQQTAHAAFVHPQQQHRQSGQKGPTLSHISHFTIK